MASRPAPTAARQPGEDPVRACPCFTCARARGLTGSIAIQCPEGTSEIAGESLIAFRARRPRAGAISRCSSILLSERRSMRWVPSMQLSLRSRKMRLEAGQGLQGEILRAMNACDAADVERGLREQIRRKVVRLFAIRNAPYQYFDGVDLLAGFGRERFPDDVFAVIWRGVRASPDTQVIEGVLAKVGTQCVRLRGGAGDLERFEFERPAREMLDGLRAEPVPAPRVLERGGGGVLAHALLYVLVITKRVEILPANASPPPPPEPRAVSEAARPPVQRPRRSSKPPRSTVPPAQPALPTVASVPPEYRDRFTEAERQLSLMEDQTYFELLGIPMSVSTEGVHSAFLDLAAKYHPDRAPAIPAIRELHQRIFSVHHRGAGNAE